jgi:hypothetical protein
MPNIYWKDIEVNYGEIYLDFKIDYTCLFYIFETFNKSFLCSKKVVFSLYHDCIIDELKNAEENSLDIINIDMHHDFYYNSTQVYNVDKLITCSEANWVLYLDKINKLRDYIWIRDNTSRLPGEEFFKKKPKYSYKFTQTCEFEITNYQFDLVFVCLSPQYIAPIHWHYFELLKNNYKNITGKQPTINNNRFAQAFDITQNNSGLIL